MIRSRKAQIFTILAVVLLILTFVSFEIFSSIRERQAINTRVSTMDSFLKSIEKNLERQMYISGFRIVFLAESEITARGSYVNVTSFFNEAFFNGTVYGQDNQSILDGATYSDIITSINNKAKKISVNVTMTNSTINVTQEDPWNVKFTLTSNFIMSDNQDLAFWNKTQVVSAYIPIEGFEDPIFTVGTRNTAPRKINKTVYDGNFVSGSNYVNLNDHVEKEYYVNNSDAPNFLMRLAGNLSADPNGIESFVKTFELPSDLYDSSKSVVDHIYFSSSNPASVGVPEMPSWFKIDVPHKSRYQIP